MYSVLGYKATTQIVIKQIKLPFTMLKCLFIVILKPFIV